MLGAPRAGVFDPDGRSSISYLVVLTRSVITSTTSVAGTGKTITLARVAITIILVAFSTGIYPRACLIQKPWRFFSSGSRHFLRMSAGTIWSSFSQS